MSLSVVDYWEEYYAFNISSVLEDIDIGCTADYSEFNVVDGEESDYGIIKYYKDDVLVATKIVHGGDREDIEFTKFGKGLMEFLLKKALLELNPN